MECLCVRPKPLCSTLRQLMRVGSARKSWRYSTPSIAVSHLTSIHLLKRETHVCCISSYSAGVHAWPIEPLNLILSHAQAFNCNHGHHDGSKYLYHALRCSLMHKHSMRQHVQNYWQGQAGTEHRVMRLPSATVAAPHRTPSAACKACVPPASPKNIHEHICESRGDQQQQQGRENECPMHSEEALLKLIKCYLQDPGFQEEVDRLEQLW